MINKKALGAEERWTVYLVRARGPNGIFDVDNIFGMKRRTHIISYGSENGNPTL